MCAPALLSLSATGRCDPFCASRSANGYDLGGVEGVVSVHVGDADLDSCGLLIQVALGYALSERIEAIHPCFHPTSDVVAD